MNIKDLHYLVAVADLKHFGRAAQACNISQPTLSMQLKKLEEYLGVALFERTNKQVMVTQAGQEIAQRARHVLQGVKEIREVARAASSPYAGEFRLGAFPTLAPYFLPQIVPAIHAGLPELKLLLVEEKTATLVEQLKSGALDAALIALPVHDEMLESAALAEDPFLLAVSPRHDLAGRKAVTAADIRNEQLLLLEDGHCLREQALEVCSIMGLGEQQEFRATSLETLRQMVVAGVGITLIPHMAKREGDGLVYIPFAKDAPSRRIGLVWRKTSARKACMELLRRIIINKYQ